MKRILIISYYWPPKRGVGVQRWLKLSKYLTRDNHELIIYTPEYMGTNLKEQTLENMQVLKTSIFEPQKILRSLFRFKYSADVLVKNKNSIIDKILIFLRANLFVPDSRFLWIEKSVKYLDDFIKNNPIDVVISTGPPHSMHLIAQKIKSLHNIKWLADFRDPWTDIEYFDKLPLLSFVKKKHIQLENLLKLLGKCWVLK